MRYTVDKGIKSSLSVRILSTMNFYRLDDLTYGPQPSETLEVTIYHWML